MALEFIQCSGVQPAERLLPLNMTRVQLKATLKVHYIQAIWYRGGCRGAAIMTSSSQTGDERNCKPRSVTIMTMARKNGQVALKCEIFLGIFRKMCVEFWRFKGSLQKDERVPNESRHQSPNHVPRRHLSFSHRNEERENGTFFQLLIAILVNWMSSTDILTWVMMSYPSRNTSWNVTI